MPPNSNPSQVVDVFVLVTGGEVGASSSLAPKIGPLHLSPKKIGEDFAKETTKDWKIRALLSSSSSSSSSPHTRRRMSITSNKKQSSSFDFTDIHNVFHHYMQQPIPFVVDFNELQALLNKMKHYNTTLYLFDKMCQWNLTFDEYTLNTVINSYCLLNRVCWYINRSKASKES